MMSIFENIDNIKEKKIDYDKIFGIVDNLIEVLTQDQDINDNDRKKWIQDFYFLQQVNEQITWKWWKQHDLKNTIANILGLSDFDNAREYIQENSEYKEIYKDIIRKNNKVIAIVDQKEYFWQLLQDLEELDTDFIKSLNVINIDPLLQNKQWKLYLLGVAYNLYKNASRFNIKNWDISVKIVDFWHTIMISSHNHSFQEFDKESKNKIINGIWLLESKKWNNEEQWQWIYLVDLSRRLQAIGWNIQIDSKLSKLWWYNTTLRIMIPKQQ